MPKSITPSPFTAGQALWLVAVFFQRHSNFSLYVFNS